MDTQEKRLRRSSGLAGSQSRGILLLLLALSQAGFGCQGTSGSADHGEEDEHASHLIPAHKPADLPSAVARLREINDRFREMRSKGEIDKDQLLIGLDIALWLPEIGADSDMPEQPWNAVAGESEKIALVYRSLTDADRSASIMLLDDSNRSIAALERLLASGDPAWFPAVKATTPSRPSSPE